MRLGKFFVQPEFDAACIFNHYSRLCVHENEAVYGGIYSRNG